MGESLKPAEESTPSTTATFVGQKLNCSACTPLIFPAKEMNLPAGLGSLFTYPTRPIRLRFHQNWEWPNENGIDDGCRRGRAVAAEWFFSRPVREKAHGLGNTPQSADAKTGAGERRGQIFCAAPARPSSRLECFGEILSVDERARAARFVITRDWNRFVAAGETLREILGSAGCCAPTPPDSFLPAANTESPGWRHRSRGGFCVSIWPAPTRLRLSRVGQNRTKERMERRQQNQTADDDVNFRITPGWGHES